MKSRQIHFILLWASAVMFMMACNPGPGDAVEGICGCFSDIEEGQGYAQLDSAAKIKLIECINDVSVVYKRERERRAMELNSEYETEKQKARYEYRDQPEKRRSELERINKEQEEARKDFNKAYKEKLEEAAKDAGCKEKLEKLFKP